MEFGVGPPPATLPRHPPGAFMGSREGETWGSWWRETAVYRWCAWAYDYASAAWFFAALPFQLLAQVIITKALRALGLSLIHISEPTRPY